MQKVRTSHKVTYGLKVTELRTLSIEELQLELKKWWSKKFEQTTPSDKAICERVENRVRKILNEKRGA